MRLDEQKRHFGPAWVRLEFVTFVTLSCFASFLDRLPDVLGPFSAQTSARSAWFWPYEPMGNYFGMPYALLDEQQKGHFGPFWVRLEFVTFVTPNGVMPIGQLETRDQITRARDQRVNSLGTGSAKVPACLLTNLCTDRTRHAMHGFIAVAIVARFIMLTVHSTGAITSPPGAEAHPRASINTWQNENIKQ